MKYPSGRLVAADHLPVGQCVGPLIKPLLVDLSTDRTGLGRLDAFLLLLPEPVVLDVRELHRTGAERGVGGDAPLSIIKQYIEQQNPPD